MSYSALKDVFKAIRLAKDKEDEVVFPPPRVENDDIVFMSSQKSCDGCKHLFFYDNGSPGCRKNLDHSCTKLGFVFKDV